jgi:hypothetical protein
MNDDARPQGSVDPDAALDPSDLAVLAEVAGMLDAVDPVPDGLVERLQFTLALDEVFAEVAQIGRVLDDALTVRTDLADATRTETLTFSADHLTAMVTLSPSGPGHVRVDGWVSPVGVRRIDFRMQGTQVEAVTDESGRFVAELRSGFVQLVFHPLDPDDGGLVVTPLFKM